MHILQVHDRTGFFSESEFDDPADLRIQVIESIKNFLLNPNYNVVFEEHFNRVQIWDDEGQIFEYKWFEN